MKLQVLTIIAMVSFVAGCSTVNPTEPPDVSEFPNREYRLQVEGTPEMVRRTISGDLERMAVPFSYQSKGQEKIIISTYVEESESAGWLREGRCAVLVSLRPDVVYPHCTSMSLKWLVESQGFFQDAWAVDGHNRNDLPSLLQRMQDYAAANACPQ